MKEQIFEICKCNINISIERFDCISDTRALCYVKVTGFMAGNLLEILQNDKLKIEFDSPIAEFHLCESQCVDSTDSVDHQHTVAIWMASSSVAILSIIIIIFLIYKYVD